MPLNPQTLQRLHEKLRQHKTGLERAAASAVAQGRETASAVSPDTADQAVLAYQREMIYKQGSSGRAQLSLIRAALDRIQEGVYGECAECGEAIGLKRLEALPWTPYCIACQEKAERGEIADATRAA